MPIVMVLTLIPSFFVIASLLGTLGGGGGAVFPVMIAVTLLASIVIGLLRFARTLESDVAASAPAENAHEVPAPDGQTSEDSDHDYPMAA